MHRTLPVGNAGRMNEAARRPLASRKHAWAIGSAEWLARRRVSPNAISACSVLCAVGVAAGWLASGAVRQPWLDTLVFIGIALGIQGRLLCNLFDGLVAVEGGLRSPTGDLWNDVPDRLADPLIIVPAGYAAGLPWAVELGWLAGLAAVLTAYGRWLGAGLGRGQDFTGPLAKPQRMAVMTVAALAAALATWWQAAGWVLLAALAVVAVGGLLTLALRLHRLAGQLAAH